jgi:hypothetical protein
MTSTEHGAEARGRRELILLIASVVLSSPIIAIYVIHFVTATELYVASGFLQYEQPYYMANAREHFDSGFTLLYGLPFSPFYDTPRIYIQPMSLLLGAFHYLTSWDPGQIYVGFGLMASLLFVRVGIELYREFVKLEGVAAWLGLVCFIWGGGLFAVAGAARFATAGGEAGTMKGFFDAIYHFEPQDGLWFMNLGRNLFYSVEAYYHLVFLLAVLLLCRRRYAAALGVIALMSASHPFTGLQLLGVVGAWALAERWIAKRPEPPFGFIVGTALLLAAHLGYYLLFLNSSNEHSVLQEQWQIDWPLKWHVMVFAYLPVAGLAIWRIRDRRRLRAVFGDSRWRLIAAWALVSVVLANHELFIKPTQQIHFTRGYIWIPIFLLGAPALAGLFSRLISAKQKLVGYSSIVAVIAVALVDNAGWLGSRGYLSMTGEAALGYYLPRGQQEVFKVLDDPRYDGHLVVASDAMTSYLTTVYTPLRTWASHWANTPNFDKRRREIEAFFRRGEEPRAWRTTPLILVSQRRLEPIWRNNFIRAGFRPVFANRAYVVRIRPASR